MVEQLFLAVPRGCLRFVIVVFPDHTHLLFLNCESRKNLVGKNTYQYSNYVVTCKFINSGPLTAYTSPVFEKFQFYLTCYLCAPLPEQPRLLNANNNIIVISGKQECQLQRTSLCS